MWGRVWVCVWGFWGVCGVWGAVMGFVGDCMSACEYGVCGRVFVYGCVGFVECVDVGI